MLSATLAPDETITFRTKGGGLVSVGLADDSGPKVPCYEADCEVCHEPSRAERTSLVKVTTWAREHAAACTALPLGYVNAAAVSEECADRAVRLLLKAEDSGEPERLLSRAEAWTRIAAVYADLAQRQP